MFRSSFPPFSPWHSTRSACTARYFHRVTTDFVTRKVPIVIGNPGETYVLIEQGVGSALRAASPFALASAACAEDRCKLTFFHDSQHFGFGSSSYTRLYVPSQFPRQTELITSPAALLLGGKMHEIVLDGTPDGRIQSHTFPLTHTDHNAYVAKFAENASASARNLESALRQLEDM
ncbi:unnamed protein product [Penicillium salamii]|nr:unnamed protein product [Penicillium salamii]CAG8278632.1 unnamed protein product [Penicillium salamii]